MPVSFAREHATIARRPNPRARVVRAPGMLACGMPALAMFALVMLVPVRPALAQDADQSLPPPGSGQPPPRMVGVHADYQRNLYQADMRGLPGFPSCCPRYEGGSGSGFALGALYQIPLEGAWLLQFRASYSIHNGTLTDSEPMSVLIGNAPVSALVEHRIDARIASVGIEPLVGYTPMEGVGLFLGGRIAYVTGALFDQEERLVQPEGVGTFENNRRTRNEVTDAPIPDASSLYTGLLGVANYRVPLSRDGVWHLVPEISYMLGLNRLSGGAAWTAGNVRTGVSVQYALLPSPPEPPPPPEPQPPPVEIVPPRLAASVTATGVDAEGHSAGTARVMVEEFESVQIRPLLSYVFFDENSTSIPGRYSLLAPADAANFSMDRLHEGNTVGAYHHLLNIIGLRMRSHPDATLRITGCNASAGAEKENRALSRARAEAVAQYLATVWNISRARLRVEARDLPENPSSADDEEGVAENRRVELSSGNDAILDPLVTRSIERRLSSDIIRFVPEVISEAGVRAWTLTVTRNGQSVRTISGEGMPPETIDWRFSEDLRDISAQGGALQYRLSVTDAAGQLRESIPQTIDVQEITVRKKREQRREDRILSRFNLILFDFRSPQLGRRNEGIIDRYIRPEIGGDVTVRIAGYTDRIGEDAFNLNLSQQRADNAARALGIQGASVKGMGESAPLYDNALPEGRFYNRTVEIEVETPVKDR